MATLPASPLPKAPVQARLAVRAWQARLSRGAEQGAVKVWSSREEK